jgi:uncharacterized lipoprotein YddW (UPF0748 family)
VKRRLLSLAATCVVAASIAMTPGAAQAGEPLEQWRGYWVDAFNEGIYNPAQAAKLVAEAQEINANALIVQTARRYDCFCNRAQYPRTDAFIDPLPYDPLDEIITRAHAAGLEVHAWVNVNTMWNSATPPSSPEHVFNQHGPDATGTDRWLNKRADGAERMGNNAFVDPGHPDAVNYVVTAIQSIVREYDVDGINLDYVRYPDYNSNVAYSDWGYNDVSVARFQAATGRADVPEASDPQWGQWRRDQVTNLVRKIYLGMWEVDPRARLSMDGITYGFGPQSVGGWQATRTYAQVLQDWKGWLEGGFMDTVVAMNYKRNWLDDQAQMFSEWSEVIADWQGERQAVNGPALYLNSVQDALEQAVEATSPTAAGNTAAGWNGYSYANPSNAFVGGPAEDRDAERAALAAALTTGPDAPFAEDAVVPSMPWKQTPTDGHVTGRLTVRGGGVLDQAGVTLRPIFGGESHTGLSDGDGWFGFAHVAPGWYFLRVDLPSGVAGQPLVVVNVSKGAITEAKLAPYTPL